MDDLKFEFLNILWLGDVRNIIGIKNAENLEEFNKSLEQLIMSFSH